MWPRGQAPAPLTAFVDLRSGEGVAQISHVMLGSEYEWNRAGDSRPSRASMAHGPGNDTRLPAFPLARPGAGDSHHGGGGGTRAADRHGLPQAPSGVRSDDRPVEHWRGLLR